MTFRTKRNTLIVLLCCLLIVGFLVTTQAKKGKWWQEPWHVQLWNWITGLKDTLEGIDALIAAFQTEIAEAEDEIARQKNRKRGHLKSRNRVKLKIQPDEQEQYAATIAANAAAAEYNAASQRASGLRVEIDALEAEMRTLSPSDPRYSEISADLAMKESELESEKATMSAEKKKYDKARSRYRYIRNKLRGDRNYIIYLTGLISSCDRKIADQEKKIENINKRIEAEQARREKVDKEIKAEEAKWEKLEKESKEPPKDKEPPN